MARKLTGTVDRVYFTSPKFTAGVLKTDQDAIVRFRGPFCASEGDCITLVGKWQKDPKYGPQFAAESLSYELPDTPEGLVQYLAKHPAFVGIGEATARKIVQYATSAANLDRLIRQDLNQLRQQLRIPKSTLVSLQEAWIANSKDNEIRSYLASFGLTNHQMDTLLDTLGNSVVGVLRADPYQLIRYVKGYGFKKVDKIARAMGTPKDHPGRIAAGLLFIVSDELTSGHTWISRAKLIEKANDLLLLDAMDSLDVIGAALHELLADNQFVSDGNAVALPRCVEAEEYIQSIFDTYGWTERPTWRVQHDYFGLKARQADAFEMAMEYPIVVISGGAGTGKTYVVARLADAYQEAKVRVALCSPTGKAAKRIEESLRAQGINLEAKTLHRLLGYDGQKFNRVSLSDPTLTEDGDIDEDSDPPYDVVIVDEVSMVDAPLMAELLRRIDFTKTRLFLVGDHNQLPPVGPGNVLRDIIDHDLVPTVILDEVVRQAGILKTNSTAVLSERIAPTATGDPAWTVVDALKDPQQIQVYLRELVLEKIPSRLGLDPIDDVQIITPTHLGALGTKAINQMMQRLLHGKVERKFAEGDKVIQTANDYGMGVMNGTIGRVIGIESGTGGGYWIDFDGCGERLIQNEQLFNVQLAYALTAHKAQGSEFPCAVVLCHKSHFFADCNWLYTAVTRASVYCILMGDRWGLRNAVKKNSTIERRTFLSLWARRKASVAKSPLEVPT